MARLRHDRPDASGGEECDRRSFLRGLGVAGGTVLTGLAAGAGAIGAAGAQPQRRSVKILPPIGRKPTDASATGALRLTRIPDPPRSTAAATAQLRLPPVRDIRPSSRADVLGLLHGRLILPSALQARSAEGEDVPTLPSVRLGTMTRVHSLASAYVEGILLTPTGCEFSGGIYRRGDPLTYRTDRGELSPSIVEQRRLIVDMDPVEADDPTTIVWQIETPGQPSERLAYTLEIHISPTSSADNFETHPPPFVLNGEPVNFTRTRSGSLLGVVEMGGNTGSAYHRLHPTTDDQRRNWIPGLEFHWLKVMAV